MDNDYKTLCDGIRHTVKLNYMEQPNKSGNMLTEKCHSSDIVSEVSDDIINRIENIVAIKLEKTPNIHYVSDVFTIEAFEELLYISFTVYIYEKEEIALRDYDDLGGYVGDGDNEYGHIFVRLELPYCNGHIIRKYRNNVEHEIMHTYWKHLKGGFVMSDKETAKYNEIMKCSENFNDTDKNFVKFIKLLCRCMYLLFNQERSAIVQSFDSVIKDELSNNKKIDRKYINDNTEIGVYMQVIDYVLRNYATYKDRIPFIFHIDTDRLENKIRNLYNGLNNMITNIVKRRSDEIVTKTN